MAHPAAPRVGAPLQEQHTNEATLSPPRTSRRALLRRAVPAGAGCPRPARPRLLHHVRERLPPAAQGLEDRARPHRRLGHLSHQLLLPRPGRGGQPLPHRRLHASPVSWAQQRYPSRLGWRPGERADAAAPRTRPERGVPGLRLPAALLQGVGVRRHRPRHLVLRPGALGWRRGRRRRLQRRLRLVEGPRTPPAVPHGLRHRGQRGAPARVARPLAGERRAGGGWSRAPRRRRVVRPAPHHHLQRRPEVRTAGPAARRRSMERRRRLDHAPRRRGRNGGQPGHLERALPRHAARGLVEEGKRTAHPRDAGSLR